MKSSIVREVKLKYEKGEKLDYQISGPADVQRFLADKIGDSCQEHFVVLCLNNKNVVNSWCITSIGTINETIVHPREIFKFAILSDSASIILSHNHPSGVLTPSREDLSTTERLKKCAELLGISILDHVIISDNNYLSLKESGQI